MNYEIKIADKPQKQPKKKNLFELEISWMHGDADGDSESDITVNAKSPTAHRQVALLMRYFHLYEHEPPEGYWGFEDVHHFTDEMNEILLEYGRLAGYLDEDIEADIAENGSNYDNYWLHDHGLIVYDISRMDGIANPRGSSCTYYDENGVAFPVTLVAAA